jgi:hypothetical protein
MMGLFSASSLSRSTNPFRYCIAMTYHLVICVLSIVAAKIVFGEVIK